MQAQKQRARALNPFAMAFMTFWDLKIDWIMFISERGSLWAKCSGWQPIVNLKTIVDHCPQNFENHQKTIGSNGWTPKKHSMVMVQLCQNHWKTIDGNGGLKKTLTIPSPWKMDHRCGPDHTLMKATKPCVRFVFGDVSFIDGKSASVIYWEPTCTLWSYIQDVFASALLPLRNFDQISAEYQASS